MKSNGQSETADANLSAHYRPNKKQREVRRIVYERFAAMRDDPIRKEEEEHWDRADKAYMQWMPDREADDWRSHLVLPDAFSAIQSNAQETIERRSRPILESVEASDLAREQFCNDVMKYSMDRTGFDYENFKAKLVASIRGTAFVMERYRYETRKVKDPDSLDDEGNIVYKEREIVDYDDTVTEFCENDTIYIDPSAQHESKARDMIEREVLDIQEFKRLYANRPGFINQRYVQSAGDLSDNTQFFKKAKDMTDSDVEILHYTNRSTDDYSVVANNVVIRDDAIPYKHKELSVSVYRHYLIPGRMYGLGIPRIIFSLSEERSSLRRLNLDRQNLNMNKVFLANDLVDIDEEDARSRPNGIIQVNTNGMNINQVIQPLEFGDISPSYYRTEEMLLEDIRRAHGIDDRIQGVQSGGTATEAAILKETAQKRINMVAVQAEMDTLIRIGRLKWSNIQFFYPAARIERITINGEEQENKVYRSVKVQGREYTVREENGGYVLDTSEIEGTSGFVLNPAMARFMEGDYDVSMNASAAPVLSKPLQQAKITEMFGLLALNPNLMAVIEPEKAVRRYLQINDEDPKMWMRGKGLTTDQWQRLAIQENNVMATGIPLVPTDGATEEHTAEHLHFMDTAAFEALPDPVKDNILQHVLGEDAARGGMGAQMAASMGLGDPNADPMGGGGSPMGGGTPMPEGGLGSNVPAESQVADLQGSIPGKAQAQNNMG
jgi:hypothetical protein